MKVIDVSEYQGDVIWPMVKEDGVIGTVIRAGYGKKNEDPKFRRNAEGAIAAGISVGIYWFSYAYTEEMARSEAVACANLIGQYKAGINMPVFFDWEYDSMNWAKKHGVTPGKDLITRMILAFCQKITELGYEAGYYLNQDYARNYVDETKLTAYKRWFAKYTVTEQKNCWLWQYTSKGRVLGISGNVDVNRLYGTVEMPATQTQQDTQPAAGVEGEEINVRMIKKGSRGKAVKIWQIIVGVEADGIFGKQTHDATIAFQQKKHLEVDGIVGKNTWKAGLESV